MGCHPVESPQSRIQLKRLVAAAAAGSSLLCGLSVVSVLGFLIWQLLLEQSTGSGHAVSVVAACGPVVVALSLQLLSAWAELLRSLWNLPGPGVEPVTPALAEWILIHCITREVQAFVLTCQVHHVQCSSSVNDIITHSVFRPQLWEASCLLNSPYFHINLLIVHCLYFQYLSEYLFSI